MVLSLGLSDSVAKSEQKVGAFKLEARLRLPSNNCNITDLHFLNLPYFWITNKNKFSTSKPEQGDGQEWVILLCELWNLFTWSLNSWLGIPGIVQYLAIGSKDVGSVIWLHSSKSKTYMYSNKNKITVVTCSNHISEKRASFSTSTAGVLPWSYQDAFASLIPAWWFRQVCCRLSTGLLQVDRQNPLSTNLTQLIVSPTCRKSANIKLQQVWFPQTWCNFMKATDFMQLHEGNRLDATSWRQQTWCNFMKATDLMQLHEGNRLDATSWRQQTWCNFMKATDLMQLHEGNKLDVTWSKTCKKCASCSKSAAGLLPCCHQDDIRMRSHRLLRLDDNKSAASCQHAWFKLIIGTLYSQAWCKVFQQLAPSLQISSCNKSDFHRLAATWRSQQICCNLLRNCSKPVKSTTCRKLWRLWLCSTHSSTVDNA